VLDNGKGDAERSTSLASSSGTAVGCGCNDVSAIAQLGAALKVVAALATKGKCGSIDRTKRGRLVVAILDRPGTATDSCVNVK
jgi:hypothetical protein